jgi:hypothetical protein
MEFFFTEKTQFVHFARLRSLYPSADPFLNNSALLFGPAAKLLGLFFNCKLWYGNCAYSTSTLSANDLITF